MFSQKRDIPVRCDAFVDLYDGCTVGCEMCKFNKDKTAVKRLDFDPDKIKNSSVLFCYSTDPYALNDFGAVENAIKKLHSDNNKIVFLTRKAECLMKQLDLFNKDDIIGISVSENCSKNSRVQDIIACFREVRKMNGGQSPKTWISLEPVLSAAFANKIIDQTRGYVDYYRVGKDDLLNYDWDVVKAEIQKADNIFVK